MEKKPWYKKWWVILIIVILIVAIIPMDEESSSAASTDTSNEKTEAKENTDSSEEKTEKESEAKDEKISLVINNVEERQLTSSEAIMATEGNVVMNVDITITNNSIADGLNMNPLYFEAETETLSGITTSIFINDDNAPDSGADIKEGASKDYTLTYEIPEGENIISITYDNIFQSVTAEVQ